MPQLAQPVAKIEVTFGQLVDGSVYDGESAEVMLKLPRKRFQELVDRHGLKSYVEALLAYAATEAVNIVGNEGRDFVARFLVLSERQEKAAAQSDAE